MIWLQPLAWIGAAAIAVPVIVHLLARRQAVVEAFPTLRFLRTAQSSAVRRHRISEWLLLAVRIAIVAAAAAALAQPFFVTRARGAALSARLARAIVVDASASMRRQAPDGRAGVDVARDRARQFSAAAAASTMGEATDVPAAIDGAVAWLRAQPGHRELVVISDFADGVVSAADIARVPAGIGVSLERIEVAADVDASTATLHRDTGDSAARATVDAERTTATWTVAVARPATAPIATIAGADDRPGADAALAAALAEGFPPTRGDRPVAIVFPRAAERDAIATQVTRLDRPWMSDVVAQLASDSALVDATSGVADVVAAPQGLVADRSTVVLAMPTGKPLLIAAARDAGGARQLVLFSMADAASVFSAALYSRAAHAVSPDAIAEAEPMTIPADRLREWQRAPSDVAPPTNGTAGDSDGRWFWIAVLVLLGVEVWLRRRRSTATESAEVVHARVA